MNLSYLKKLKKRLLDTTEFFQVKGETDMDNGKPISDERRVFLPQHCQVCNLNLGTFHHQTIYLRIFFVKILQVLQNFDFMARRTSASRYRTLFTRSTSAIYVSETGFNPSK